MPDDLTITGPEVEGYLAGLLPERDPMLVEMEAQAKSRDIPIVGPVVGRLLYFAARLVGARRIFEFGSAIGYSTLWWARAAGENGEVFYTDHSPENQREAARYFARAGVGDRIRQLPGDALAAFAATTGEFDVIFCDLDKPFYPEVLRVSLPRLRAGGLLVADNVLWKGRVARPDAACETQAILEFNRAVYQNPELFPVIVPLRDGVLLARKK